MKRIWNHVLTGLSITGMLGTGVLIADATRRAMKKLDGTETKKEVVKKCWKNYIAPTILFVATSGCMIANDANSTAAQNALITACASSNLLLEKWKEATKHVYGEESSDNIQQEILECSKPKIHATEKEELYFLSYYVDLGSDSNGYFLSTPTKIDEAMRKLNEKLHCCGSVTVSDFMEYVGVEPNVSTGVYGWGKHQLHQIQDGWVKTDETLITLDNGEEVTILEFDCLPSVDFECEALLYCDGDYPEDYELEGRKMDVSWANHMAEIEDLARAQSMPWGNKEK